MAVQAPSPSNTTNQKDALRSLAYFSPSIFDSNYFTSFPFPHSEFDSYTKDVEMSKEKVKDMLMTSAKDPAKNIELIYTLCRLDISYHFASEVKEQLNHIFNCLHTLLHNNDYGLYTLSLLFLVLRQHGFNMPCDVFEKFNDENGKFKSEIVSDVRGMLSLYEACQLSVHGEDIMEEALTFTTENLELLATESKSHLAEHIKNALKLPFHKGIPRLEARRYISFYQVDESCDETLLKLAILDFNRLQLLQKLELAVFLRWWKELNIGEKLPYIRDRIVEIYVWAMGICGSKPQYTLARMIVSKVVEMISVVDDTYDAYGTFDELQLFTNAFERGDSAAIDELPDYMKLIYTTYLNVLDEVDKIVSQEGRPYAVEYGREAFKELVGSYMQEAKWLNEGCVPPLDDYLNNGYDTSAYRVIIAACFIGMKTAGVIEHEWLKSNPKILRAASWIGRLENDISSHREEQERGHCASAVECYMKEYSISEEEAIQRIKEICENLWKDINEECFKMPSKIPMPLLKSIVNISRCTEVVYNQQRNGYTNPSTMKDEITSLFIEKIPMPLGY